MHSVSMEVKTRKKQYIMGFEWYNKVTKVVRYNYRLL